MSEQLELLSVDSLHPAKWNRDIGDVDELAASIKDIGLIEPIIVRPNENGFQIVAGERRATAAKKAGLAEIPVIVRHLDDRQALEVQLIENLQRKDIEPLEEAHGYKLLVDFGVKQAEIAEKVRRSPAHVSKRLALLDLPETAQKALSSGKLSLEDAPELRRLKDKPELVDDVVGGGRDWRSMKQRVTEALRANERETKIAELTKKLNDEGCKFAKERPGYGAKTMPLAKNDYRGGLGILTAKHKPEPCHAAYVDGGGYSESPKIVYVCTDPSRHSKGGKSEIKVDASVLRAGRNAPSASEKRERQERNELRKARPARLETLKKIVAGRAVGKADAFSIIAWRVIRRNSNYTETGVLACKMLGLDNEHDGDALVNFAAESDDNLRRAALAATLASIEISDVRSTWSKWGEEEEEFFDLLEAHGYELCDAETKKLGRTKS